MKKILTVVGQLILLVVGYFVISMVSGSLSGSAKLFELTNEQTNAAGFGLICVAFFQSALLLYLSKKSNWFGIKLFLAILSLHFGVTVCLTQIESYVFLDQLVQILPKSSLLSLVLDGSILAVLFSLLVVTVAGKWKKEDNVGFSKRLEMSLLAWILKIFGLGIVYYFIYILFGALVMIPIAGQEAFQSYYSGLEVPSWLPILQIFRGIIWVMLALPIISMLKGKKLEIVIVIGLSFAILMGFNLLIPLPFMPERIRMAHFVEVTTSNFVFGMIVAYVMLWRSGKKAARAGEDQR